MKRLRIHMSHILQTELQGSLSDLDLLGKYIHRQTIWLDLHGCSVLLGSFFILYSIVIRQWTGIKSTTESNWQNKFFLKPGASFAETA